RRVGGVSRRRAPGPKDATPHQPAREALGDLRACASLAARTETGYDGRGLRSVDRAHHVEQGRTVQLRCGGRGAGRERVTAAPRGLAGRYAARGTLFRRRPGTANL